MKKQLVAMILAGGKGTRLYELTKKNAKPAVFFGGRYRIIDFPLSNCSNSGINTVGILTQYESIDLASYIGNGEKWGLNGVRSTTVAIAPKQTEKGSNWFVGTADAIFQNLEFLDRQDPENVLILSGDHIYEMDYQKMLDVHLEKNADLTIAVLNVTYEEAKRFGIMSVDENDQIIEFEEKPAKPKSTLASMGIYIFNYEKLREVLIRDSKDENSDHDFGKNIIPTMLKENCRIFAYRFNGYWKDVGTIASLWEANMDLIDRVDEEYFKKIHELPNVYSEDTHSVPHYVGKEGHVTRSIVNQGAIILGNVNHSVISNEVLIEEDCEIESCVVMPGVTIRRGSKIKNAIIAPDIEIEKRRIENQDGDHIVLIYE
ncbi:MAG: glucose-1-phosphate adenylyltransferase [Bacilli bacterium]|jgi:glucose-1-phosphate adenylyltransferase